MFKRWDERILDLKNAISRLEEGIENIATPKSTIRESFKVGIVKNVDTWLEMIDDRNLTSHIYNQSLADDIYTRIATKYIKELKLNLEYMSRVEL